MTIAMSDGEPGDRELAAYCQASASNNGQPRDAELAACCQAVAIAMNNEQPEDADLAPCLSCRRSYCNERWTAKRRRTGRRSDLDERLCMHSGVYWAGLKLV